jgi:hypothetical protein
MDTSVAGSRERIAGLADKIATLSLHIDLAKQQMLTYLREFDAHQGWVGTGEQLEHAPNGVGGPICAMARRFRNTSPACSLVTVHGSMWRSVNRGDPQRGSGTPYDPVGDRPRVVGARRWMPSAGL